MQASTSSWAKAAAIIAETTRRSFLPGVSQRDVGLHLAIPVTQAEGPGPTPVCLSEVRHQGRCLHRGSSECSKSDEHATVTLAATGNFAAAKGAS
jgi:hypothetical protein